MLVKPNEHNQPKLVPNKATSVLQKKRLVPQEPEWNVVTTVEQKRKRLCYIRNTTLKRIETYEENNNKGRVKRELYGIGMGGGMGGGVMDEEWKTNPKSG